MDAIAHLRVFEPAEAFPAALGPALADAAGRDRAAVEAEADRRTLARITRRRVDPFPHPEEPDLIRATTAPDGRTRFCPDQLARRAAYSAASLERLLEPERFSALVPEPARRRHTAALDAAPRPGGGSGGEPIRTRSSLWGVPHSWLLLLDPEEEPAAAPAAEDSEGRPFRARRTTGLLEALIRCGRAARILRDHAPDTELLGELTELSGWLELFGSEAVVELDYGRLTGFVWPDESPYDLWTLLSCLEEQDEATAAVAQERLNRRWGMLTLQARAH